MPVRIPIVEDNEANLQMLSRSLQRSGCVVESPVAGIRGLKMARATLPDLILTDLSLPEMDCREVIGGLNAQALTRHKPIIAPSSLVLTCCGRSAMSTGSSDFDSKPVDLQRLLSKTESFMSGGIPK